MQHRASLKPAPRISQEEMLARCSPFGLEEESRNISFIRVKTAFVYPKSLIRALQAIKWQTATHEESHTLTPAEFHRLAGQILLAYSEQELLEGAFSVEQKEQRLALHYSPFPAFPVHPR